MEPRQTQTPPPTPPRVAVPNRPPNRPIPRPIQFYQLPPATTTNRSPTRILPPPIQPFPQPPPQQPQLLPRPPPPAQHRRPFPIPPSAIPSFLSHIPPPPAPACGCGWYSLPSLHCPHLFGPFKRCCGDTYGRLDRPVFCAEGAPAYVVGGYGVDRVCEGCWVASGGRAGRTPTGGGEMLVTGGRPRRVEGNVRVIRAEAGGSSTEGGAAVDGRQRGADDTPRPPSGQDTEQ